MAVSAFIFEGTDLNFDQLVLEYSRKGLVMVDFQAPWLGPWLSQRELPSKRATDYDGRSLLAAVSLVEDDYDAAVDALMEILRRDRGFDDGAARRGLLTLFDTLGGGYPLVGRYRGELAHLVH
jgi:thioredoxin-like negative regulator of GroEL